MKEELAYRVEIRDKHGKVIKVITPKGGKAHSFLRQYTDLKYLRLKASGSHIIKDTDGVDRSCACAQENLEASAAADVTNHGIRVGKGNTAVTISDYALDDPIEQGVGENQMDYLIQEIGQPVVAASDSKFELKRIVYNGSGASIGIWEVGIYTKTYSTYNACVARDVLPAVGYVPDGGSITVFYYIRVAV